MTRDTMLALVLLKGQLPQHARFRDRAALPREIQLLATERRFVRGKPTGIDHLKPHFAQLYPVEQMELGEDYAVWVSQQTQQPRQTRVPQRFNPVSGIEPVVALAIIADSDRNLSLCLQYLRSSIRESRQERVVFLDAVERHPAVRRMLYEWIESKGPETRAWQLLSDLVPTPEHTAFLQKHLTGRPDFGVAAQAASVLEGWVVTDHSEYLQEPVTRAAKLPATYFPFVATLFSAKRAPMGAPMAMRFLADVAAERITARDYLQYFENQEESDDQLAVAVWLALNLVQTHAEKSDDHGRVLAELRKRIESGALRGFQADPAGAATNDAGGDSDSGGGFPGAGAGGGLGGGSGLSREHALQVIDRVPEKFR